MRLSTDIVFVSLGGIPIVGNLATGGIIGLTEEGARLCRRLAREDVTLDSVPQGCRELVEHLRAGGYLEGASAPQARLESAYLHVTQRCNLSCRFCYSEDGGRNRLPDPTLDELCRAIDLLAALGCGRLVISGGEPFLRDDLADIARHARASGISDIIVLTNGLLVDEKSVRPLAEAVSCVAVAFDGTSAQSTAHLRRAQNYDRLVAAVRAIGDAGIEPRILPTLHARNLSDMARYQELAGELKATLSYSLLTAAACDLGGFALDDQRLRELGTRSAESGARVGDSLGERAPSLRVRHSCGAGVRTLSIGADGTIYPCQMLHDHRFSMGNAFGDSPAAIARSPVAKTFRELRVDSFEGCSSCDVRHLCGGGCRARAFLSTGSLTRRDPYCELSRSYYEAIGEQLARQFGTKGGDGHAV